MLQNEIFIICPIKLFLEILNQPMKQIRQKRDQIVREMRTNYRNQIFSSHRSNFLEQYDNLSLIPMIFTILDQSEKQQNQLPQESLQDFFQTISFQIAQQAQNQKVLNQQIIMQVQLRYKDQFSNFLSLIQKAERIQKIKYLYSQNSKFNLLRFFVSVQKINNIQLNVLDGLLDSANERILYLVKQIKNNRIEKEKVEIEKQVCKILKLIGKIIKDILYLSYSLEKKILLQVQNKDIKIYGMKEEKQTDKKGSKDENNLQIEELIVKRLVEKQLFAFMLDEVFVEVMGSEQNERILGSLVNLFNFVGKPYLTFLLTKSRILQFPKAQTQTLESDQHFTSQENHSTFLQTLIHQTIMQNKLSKFIQIIFLLLNSCFHFQKHDEIQIISQNLITQQNSLFLKFQHTIYRFIQAKYLTLPNPPIIAKKILDLFIQFSLSHPLTAFNNFIYTIHQFLPHFMNTKNTQILFNMFFKFHPQKYSLVCQFLRNIQDFSYQDLLFFIQNVSIIASYNQDVIYQLFNVQEFEGYYGETINFQIVLQKKLMRHISIQIRRRTYWLITNITASQMYYEYGLNFIKTFYKDKVFENEVQQKQGRSREQNLIRQSMLQSIMNYMSNIRQFEEIEKALKFVREKEGKNSKKEVQTSTLHEERENLLVWILKIYGSVLSNISIDQSYQPQRDKFLQILTYSLYNLIVISKQKTIPSQNIILQILEQFQIIKILENMYQKIPLQQSKSKLFQMLQQLLDQIQKLKKHL